MAAAMAPVYLMEPPPGRHRTTINPPTSGGAVVPVGIAATLVACVCVALRIFTRVHVVSGDLGSDDYLVLCALVLSITFFFVGRHLYTVGAGLHMWDVLYSDYSPRFLQTTVGATLSYALSISFSKLSILAFYLRVSPDQNFRRAVYALLGVVVAYTVAYIFVIVFRCSPVSAAWDLGIKGGACIEYLVPMMVLSIANIVIDVVILLLPVKVIVPLQIPVRQKISLVFLFATGGFVCTAAIKRTIIMPPLLASSDYSWDLTEQFIWSFVEVNAGIVCASLAALKPLFMRYLPVLIVSRLRSTSAQDRSAASGNAGSGAGAGYASSSSAADAETKCRTTVSSSSNGALCDEEEGEAPSYEMAAPPPRRASATALSTITDKPRHLVHHHLHHHRRHRDQNQNQHDSDDAVSADGMSDLYPGATSPTCAVSGGGFDALGPRSSDGVRVTKETCVTY